MTETVTVFTFSCLNGGIVNKDRCVCPPGRYALNCEQRGCLPSIQTDEGITKNPSFILVVSIKSTMAYVLNELANKLEITLDNFFASARYTEYIVVSYVHTSEFLGTCLSVPVSLSLCLSISLCLSDSPSLFFSISLTLCSSRGCPHDVKRHIHYYP